ncbi:MAG: diversity-generating retroelement protein Avd [Geitlerinemataceae cyanobacterium]
MKTSNSSPNSELPVIQQTYDLVKWYVPILNRLPRSHKFALGDRMVAGLYDLLEGLVAARYATQKLAIVQPLTGRVNVLKYQTRLLLDFRLVEARRYEYASRKLDEVGRQLGGWVAHLQQ